MVFSDTFEEHLARLGRVFTRLRTAGLTLKRSKCVFVENDVHLLGHIVGTEGIKPDPAKLEAIRNFPTPRNVKGIQSFLGLCNYYHKFIENFSKTAKPLHTATRKDIPFQWTQELQNTFDELKEKMVNAPVLAHFNPNIGTELRTDALLQGLGAVLLQKGPDNELHPLAYASRTLTKAEKNYGISELEALGVVRSLGYMRHLIYGRPVNIVTDHAAICYLKTVKNPTGRLARWAIKLSEYDYSIVYKSGKTHCDADALSRNPVGQAIEEDEAEAPPPYVTWGS